MSEPAVYLFVYGTLQPGFINPFAQMLHHNSRCAGPGIMSGRLYNIGQYPGAVHDPNSSASVHGTIFDITETPNLLTRLDHYEGVGNPPTPADEYIRDMVHISFGTVELRCWTYLYNWPVLESQQIVSGRYSMNE